MITASAERNRRYRDKKRGGPPRTATPFWERVDVGDGCWLWRGYKNRQGYGVVWVKGRQWRAHRLMWHAYVGTIPQGHDVLHHCDNPSCVRPDHLFIGTDRDNAADRESKGRGNHHDGHGRAKLTMDQANEIRRLYRDGVANGPQLSRRYGVHHRQVYAVIHDKAWKCPA